MARKPRIEIEGGLYHIISRGNNRKRIFASVNDYVQFLSFLERKKSKLPFYLYAYCLMPNHLHLLVEMREDQISRIMQGLLTAYSKYYNRKYRKTGHLFQGRYKSILCQSDRYLGELVRYIHLNPVRAKIVASAEDYVYSGHRSYLGLDGSGLVDAEAVLRHFGPSRRRAIEVYRQFVESGVGQGSQEEYYRAAEGRILGSEEFLEQVKHRVGEFTRSKKERVDDLNVEMLLAVAEKVSGIKRDWFCGAVKTRSIVAVKESIIVVGYEMGLRNRDLATGLRIDMSAVSKRRDAARIKGAAAKDTTVELQKMLKSELLKQRLVLQA